MLYPERDLGPRVLQFPHERLAARFGTYFMTSSFSWMMAMAIDEMAPIGERAPKGSEIGVWGVDMEYGTEYREQRVGLRHFMDVARIVGINVTRLASGGVAYEPVPYPLIQDDPLLQKLALRDGISERNLATAKDSLRMVETMIATNKGALNEVATAQVEDYDPAQRGKDLQREVANLEKTRVKLERDIAHLEGVRAEQSWLRDFLSP
jgi:hypothetical protein